MKRIFLVPGEWSGKSIQLRFGCATHRATVYVNGVMIASHEGGFLPFIADITEVAEYNKMNKVVVFMNNELSDTTIPYGRTVTLEKCSGIFRGENRVFRERKHPETSKKPPAGY